MRLLAKLSLAALVVTFVAGTAFAGGGGKGKQPAGGNASASMEFEPESGSSSPPSKTLERAIKLYDKKDFFSASIELKKVLDGESGDDAKNKQRAEFFMGKTLYQMGFYAGALTYFENIVKAGDQHTYHGATLKWLAALSRVLPETSDILKLIGSYDPSALNDPSLAELFAVPLEWRYILSVCAPGGGQSSKSRHSLRPIVKTRTGFSLSIPFGALLMM